MAINRVWSYLLWNQILGIVNELESLSDITAGDMDHDRISLRFIYQSTEARLADLSSQTARQLDQYSPNIGL